MNKDELFGNSGQLKGGEMNKLQLRFMYLTIRFLAKFMLYGEEMRNPESIGTEHFINELVILGDNLRDKLEGNNNAR